MHDDKMLSLEGMTAAAMTSGEALAAPDNDPVFAAIARHREAERAWSAALRAVVYNETEINALDRAADDAFLDWLTTMPTTMAGVLATLDYASFSLGGEGGDRTVLSDTRDSVERFPATIAAALRKWDSVARLEQPARQFPALIAAALRRLVTV